TYATTTSAQLPEEIQKAQLDTQAAKQMLDAQQKIYNSRQELFQQGAIPRKELDQAGVDLTQARNQYQIAQKHLDALMATGKQQALKSTAVHVATAQGKYTGPVARMSYSQMRSQIAAVFTERP